MGSKVGQKNLLYRKTRKAACGIGAPTKQERQGTGPAFLEEAPRTSRNRCQLDDAQQRIANST